VKPEILVIDDDIQVLDFFKNFFIKKDFIAHVAENWFQGEQILFSKPIDVLLLDLQLPGRNGIEILKEVKKQFPLLETVIFSGNPNVEVAVEAIKVGAFDFIEKTYSIEKIFTIIENAFKIKKLKEENLFLKKIKNHITRPIIGESKTIQRIKKEILIASQSDATVLITGENGTGKQIVAESIHQASPRAHANFIDINCAAIPENLLESELFGYEKGAFTGAVQMVKGKFELSHEGSFFLDEIGEMSLALQAKLLKVLESKTFSRLGGNNQIHLNTRMIAATNIDIQKEIEQNTFRKDLFYRLNVIPIHIPPLRERLEDIPLLIRAFLKEIGKEEKKFSDSALQLLSQYHWPGNVRELRNIVERTVIMTPGKKIMEKEEVAKYLQHAESLSKPQENLANLSLKDYLAQKEKNYLERVLKESKNQKIASETLKIDRTVLYRKIKKYNIKI